MIVFALLFLITLFSFSVGQNYTDLDIGVNHKKLKTQGNLIPERYRFVLDPHNPNIAIRTVLVTSNNSELQNPFTVTIVRGKTIMNIALPRILSSGNEPKPYWSTSDTMCDADRSQYLVECVNIVVSSCQLQLNQPVFVSVSSWLPTEFNLKVKFEDKFILGHEPIEVKASPSEPRFYLYTFPEHVHKVFVKIESESEVCAKITTRRTNCPVFDDAGYVGMTDVNFYQSFTKLGAFYVKKSVLGSSFHLTFTVDPDDLICGPPTGPIPEGRLKKAVIKITPLDESTFPAVLPLIVYLTSILAVLIFSYFHSKWLDKQENNEPNILEGTDSEGTVFVDKIKLFDKPMMIVSHREYIKQRVIKESKYFSFVCFQIFGSLLPSLTHLFRVNLKVHKTTNLDSCYMNFLCASSFLNFTSFNGITSASSSMIIGIVNLILVFRKKIFHYTTPKHPTSHGVQRLDAPKVVFLLSIISLGFLWTIASNCNKKMTIHLYAYAMTWIFLSAVMWIYSKRHGIRKWQQLFSLVVSSTCGLFAFVENTFDMAPISITIMKAAFVVFSCVFGFVFCYKYCYERPSGLQIHQWICSPLNCEKNILRDEFGVYQPLASKKVFVVIFMVFTVSCSLLPFHFEDYSVTQCMMRLTQGQAALYLFYFMVQKVRFEWSSMTRWFIFNITTLTIFLTGSVSFWIYLYNYRNPYFILKTPAKSRELNTECIVSGLDWTDIRHYDTALVFVFFILLMDYIDSNINGAPKRHIFVF